MPTLIFSPTALRDLERLRVFLRTKNIKAAREATRAVLTALQSLELYPTLGRTVENRSPDYRELIIPFGHNGYIAAYRYMAESETLLVLGLWHQREQREH